MYRKTPILGWLTDAFGFKFPLNLGKMRSACLVQIWFAHPHDLNSRDVFNFGGQGKAINQLCLQLDVLFRTICGLKQLQNINFFGTRRMKSSISCFLM